ncbi:hypothetical protein [Enterococcus faecalis]|uniref:hypothetical protein n=1 Tax=Enterococcus faecalis TaxID=1351 RepID=UPI0019E01407|nr:hypothetical protein [Enterococcus faecalis]EGO6704129.1 hypothetical protein [Enterococcus faecalis]MCU9756313.1 hypothetical protein [Enterococcus faecalis]MCU9775028.1 hypothetical protein [Enterococcus faecalis]MCU9791878.1 hypothetical protein [Enterococcus faecalis]HEC4826789.1 hypothetical protein [Enterococcus faecalis]
MGILVIIYNIASFLLLLGVVIGTISFRRKIALLNLGQRISLVMVLIGIFVPYIISFITEFFLPHSH